MRRRGGGGGRHQVAFYLLAIAAGAAVGGLLPATAPWFALAVVPALALLLFVTFLGVPFLAVARALRDVRFVGTVVVVNVVVAPLAAFGLSRFVTDDDGLLLGLLLVLLTPCIDYVVVFTGLAGGAKERLLAATPLLMVLQIVLLPLYLRLFAGEVSFAALDVRPFIEAFAFLIALPLLAAAGVQLLARRHRAARVLSAGAAGAMVPLMMLVLLVVVASQTAALGGQAAALVRLVPIYAAFLAIMLLAGILVARVARLPVAQTHAVVFSGATRNSLVVLPLALAASFPLTPLAVVTQTLVEVIGMVVFVWLVPRLTRPPR